MNITREALEALVAETLLDMDTRNFEFADDSLTAAERREIAVETIVEGVFG